MRCMLVLLFLFAGFAEADYSWTRSTIGGGGGEPGLGIDPNDDDIAYVGADLGGIIKTVNRGESWFSVQNNLPNNWIADIKVDPLDSQIVYVTAVLNLHNKPPNGELYRSYDGGESWNILQGAETGVFAISHLPSGENILIPYDRSDPGLYDSDYDDISDVILIGAWGENYHKTNPNGNSGIWKSTDEGETFRQITLETSNIHFIAQHPDNPNVLYAGTADQGLYKSNDLGETWSKVNIPGLETDAIADISFVAGTGIIYLAVDGIWSDKGGVWKSTDNGDSWSQVNSPNFPDNLATIVILADNQDPSGNTVFAGFYKTAYSIFKTTDGGGTWEMLKTHSIPSPPGPHWFSKPWFTRIIRIEQGTGGTIYLTTGRGSHVYDAAEDKFMIKSTGLGNTVVKDIEFGGEGEAYLAILDSAAPFKTTDGGRTWINTIEGFDACIGDKIGDMSDIAVSETDPNIVIATGFTNTQTGTTIAKSTDAGETWSTICNGLPQDTSYSIDAVEMNPADHNIIVLTMHNSENNRVYRSINGGVSWSHVADIARPYTKIRFTADGNTVVIGAGIKIYISNDGGLTFNEKSIPIDVSVYAVDVCPQNKDIIAAGVNILGLYLSKDQGATWELIFNKNKLRQLIDDGNLALSDWSYANIDPKIKAVRFDSDDCNIIYAGHAPAHPYTGLGLLRTNNQGSSWEVISDNTILGSIYNIDIEDEGSEILVGGLEVGFGILGSSLPLCQDEGGECCVSGEYCPSSLLDGVRGCSVCCSILCEETVSVEDLLVLISRWKNGDVAISSLVEAIWIWIGFH